MNVDNKKIWLVTGISSGLGKELANHIIDKGEFLIGTFRNQDQVDNFNAQHANNAFALKLDITDIQSIENATSIVLNKFGRLDVLVNNAGFGMAGAIEETSIEETRKIFESNFFGTLQMTQKFLPLFRTQRSGHIIQISSQAGIKATQGFGIYNATKFAVEGFSEALSQEVSPLGIHVSLVEPGPFRTDFAGRSLATTKTIIEDYKETAGIFRNNLQGISGKQEGDPVKAAKAIFELSKMNVPPLRLPLGKIALASIEMKLESVKKDIESCREIAEGAVFESN